MVIIRSKGRMLSVRMFIFVYEVVMRAPGQTCAQRDGIGAVMASMTQGSLSSMAYFRMVR